MEPSILQNFLLALIAAAFIILIQIVDFGITSVRRKRRMKDYDQFVNGLYTCKGKSTPALLLRIQNEYIKEYNELGRQWLGRRLFRLRIYPERRGTPSPSPTHKIKKHESE